MVNKGTMVWMGILAAFLLTFQGAPAQAYVITASTISTDGSSSTFYSGVSAISDSRIVVSFNHSSLGKALRFYDVTPTGVTNAAGGSVITGTSSDLLDVAYIGFNGTEEMFYVNRDASTDVFEFWWNPALPSGSSGTYKGIVSKYNNGSNFPGMDREFGGTADELLMTVPTRLYHVDGSGSSASWSTFYGPVGTGEFTGITGLGDINNDGLNDYAVTRNIGGAGRLHIVQSSGGSYSLGSEYIAAGSRSYEGIANLGDPDSDGYVEMALVATNANGSGKGYISYVQTDVPYIPEPASLLLVTMSAVALLRRRQA